MANHGRKFARALALAALCLLLGGCAMNVSTDKLYALPSLPAEYASLEAEINALLSDGAEHAAPISGSNLQSVQMVDLDGDGVEEAVAFFRKATDERPVKIYFFRSNGDSYEAVVENNREMYAAWKSGDIETVTQLVTGEFDAESKGFENDEQKKSIYSFKQNGKFDRIN